MNTFWIRLFGYPLVAMMSLTAPGRMTGTSNPFIARDRRTACFWNFMRIMKANTRCDSY
ncbi:uncharacterized protein METZ01_LOCUS325933 [marine metagenome]|uniref:Uncharacterized protein n=1 Tax=marine metagenome TaxID=408172 RepID=A0A382PI58_9ZZZZ